MSFMVRTSWAVRSTAGMMFVIDSTTAVLLLISMKKVYTTIQTHYSLWNPNRVFIALQVISFVAPVLMALACIIFYHPQINFAGTLTYSEMMMYCLFQVSISIVMIMLLYVVTAYSQS